MKDDAPIELDWSRLAQECRCLDMACITPQFLPRDYLRLSLLNWQNQGNLGALSYIDSRADLLVQPFQMRPWAKAAIVLTFAPQDDPRSPLLKLPPPPEGGPVSVIAAYALNEDYHLTGRRILQRLQEELVPMAPPGDTTQFDLCVDTKPVLEKELAELAHLGIKGYNSLIHNATYGSQIHLAVAFTSISLSPFIPSKPDLMPCTFCGKCLRQCPNHVFDTQGHFTVRHCRAWLSSECRTPFTKTQQKLLGNTLFGCGLCTETCPSQIPPKSPLFVDPMAIMELPGNGLQNLTRHTVLERAGATVLKRNAAATIFNQTPPEKWKQLAGKFIRQTNSQNLKISLLNSLNE